MRCIFDGMCMFSGGACPPRTFVRDGFVYQHMFIERSIVHCQNVAVRHAPRLAKLHSKRNATLFIWERVHVIIVHVKRETVIVSRETVTVHDFDRCDTPLGSAVNAEVCIIATPRKIA